ncbi:MAG: hypothetical protein K8F91_15130 [Candidatus Obscuribacterales bacterium]|nr:hypothetical protein [Candidatus Obscuribacterales bacterium]
MPYKNFSYDQYTFVFKYDDEFPEHLHIYVRHLKNPEDAVEIWFEGEEEVWNAEFERYETSTETETVFWYWIEENKIVMIISCFDK